MELSVRVLSFLYLSGLDRFTFYILLPTYMSETLEQKMCRRSKGYSFVRNVFVRPAFYLFYKKIDVIGKKDVLDEGPIIFTPNHQNALMDALSILCTKNRQLVFVARADIFHRPLIIRVLHFLRILPIYRKRDGGSSSDNNQETFDIIHQALLHGQAVGMMPEGTHNEIKRLRVLQKGVFRLAMQVQENYGNRPVVKIIPVGIEYSNTNKFRSNLIVRYGEAIEVSDYYDLHVENPAKAFKVMQDVLSEKMKDGMINIDNEAHYDAIERIRVFYLRQAMQRFRLAYRNAEDRLRVQQKIIAAMQDHAQTDPEAMAGLCTQINEYTTLLDRHCIRDWVVERQPYSFIGLMLRTLLMLLGLPFWVLGMLFNYLPYKLSAFSSRKIKDPQFVSSVQFVAGLVLFPVYHCIMIVLLVLFVPCIWGKFIMPVLILPLGWFAFTWYLSVKKLCARYRFWNGTRRQNPGILKTIELRQTIFTAMDKIMEAHAG